MMSETDDQIAASDVAPNLSSCVLDILDMHCAACAILIEDAMAAVTGVSRVRVHYATQRARVTFDPGVTDVGNLLLRIERLGYTADAGQSVDRAGIARRQRHKYIWAFGLSAFCAMQIMMLTLPRFIAGTDIEPELAPLLDWAAFMLILPVIGWCARPFYRGTLRELRLRRPGMDSAITLGIFAAFAGSLWHLFTGTGVLYFDSVAMFVALLLGVRWFEWEQRERNQAVITAASHNQVSSDVMRLHDGDANGVKTAIAVDTIVAGDYLWIRTGEAIPVDGVLESGAADCDESLLTGESASVRRTRGQTLIAGAVNAGAAIAMRATSTADTSTARRLLALADDSEKPESLALADLVARYFMPALILVSAATFAAMLPAGVAVAAERAIAVLIISCPCALALAAPAAHARAFAGLLQQGMVLRRTGAISRLAKADAFLLDKTGTLSAPQVNGVVLLRPDFDEARALQVIVALERAANHPLAVAVRSKAAPEDARLSATELAWVPGEGVSGVIGGCSYRFGRASFVGASGDSPGFAARLWLADDAGIIGALELSEAPRDDARPLVRALQQRGIVEILSGDRDEKTQIIAQKLAVRSAAGALTPEQKAQRVRQLRREGRITVMIGDGINDSVGFAGADVGIAVHGATDAAKASADIVCLSPNLGAIASTIDYAVRVGGVVRGNFVWAIAYNLIAIPFAIAGFVNPLIASVGMAASSAVVIANVMRLGSVRKATT